MIDELVAALKSEEGWNSRPYRDTENFVTIGYGFLIDERKPVELPKRVGDLWIEILAESTVLEMLDRWPWLVELPENTQSAVAQMCYQMGVAGVAEFTDMMSALAVGDLTAAKAHALDSKWARQTTARAKRVAELLLG